MATVNRPKILAYELGVGANLDSSRFSPAAGISWEVHSIIVSTPATVYRVFDPNQDGVWEVSVSVISLPEGGEFHGFKFEVDEYSGLVIHNDDATNTMDVVLVGVEIT